MSRPMPGGEDPAGSPGPGGPPPGAGPGGPPPGGPPPGGAPPGAMQGPADPTQRMLASMFQVFQTAAAENPQISEEMTKAAELMRQAQTKLLMGGGPRAPIPPEQNPPV